MLGRGQSTFGVALTQNVGDTVAIRIRRTEPQGLRNWIRKWIRNRSDRNILGHASMLRESAGVHVAARRDGYSAAMDALVTVALLWVVVVGLWLAKRKGKAAEESVDLAPGEDLRPLAFVALEPWIEIVLVGVLLWDDLAKDYQHWIAAAVGLVPGVIFGIHRARVMYVRAVPEFHAVVLVRDLVGDAAIVVLIVIRVVAETGFRTSAGFNLALTLLLSLAISESLVRAALMVRRYRADTAVSVVR
jgi:hypothetical protein